MADPVRTPVLEGRLFSLDGISIEPAGLFDRIVLRADSRAKSKLEKVLGLKLPTKPKTSNQSGNLVALWIGPDEWLVLTEAGGDLIERLTAVKSDLFSAVAVTHRNTAVTVSGSKAEAVLNAGCPQDLSLGAFAIGAASRTVFGKAEIVLWRTGEQDFHLECWRSFSDYVWKFLVDAAKLT